MGNGAEMAALRGNKRLLRYPVIKLIKYQEYIFY